MNELTIAALATNQDNLVLGNQVLFTDGARFIRNVAAPSIYDANFVDTITVHTAAGIEALLARAEQAYAHTRHLRFDVDARTPPEFEARLCLDDAFSCSEALVLALEGEMRA